MPLKPSGDERARAVPDATVVAITVDPYRRGMAVYGWTEAVAIAERYVDVVLGQALGGGLFERRGPLDWLWRSVGTDPADIRAFDAALLGVSGVRIADPAVYARFIDVRMGIAHRSVVQETPWDDTDLTKVADIALGEAIEFGDAVVIARPGMLAHAWQRSGMAAELAAVPADDWQPVYQPIVKLVPGAVAPAGYESLLRWRRGGTLVGPDVFMDVLETTEMIVPVGRAAIARSLGTLAGPITDTLGSGAFMSVNLSAAQLRDQWLGDYIEGLLGEYRLDPSRLWFEISENAVVTQGSVADRAIGDLHELGCGICVDDLGAGFAALGYLRNLPIDVLKVDRALVSRMPSERMDRAVVRAICDLASAAGVLTVAEGVESQAVLSVVEELGFDMAQGYLFGRPGPVQ